MVLTRYLDRSTIRSWPTVAIHLTHTDHQSIYCTRATSCWEVANRAAECLIVMIGAMATCIHEFSDLSPQSMPAIISKSCLESKSVILAWEKHTGASYNQFLCLPWVIIIDPPIVPAPTSVFLVGWRYPNLCLSASRLHLYRVVWSILQLSSGVHYSPVQYL